MTIDLPFLESYFKTHKTEPPVQIAQGVVIFDVDKMVETHISYCKNYSGQKRFQPYFDRLLRLYEYSERKRA